MDVDGFDPDIHPVMTVLHDSPVKTDYSAQYQLTKEEIISRIDSPSEKDNFKFFVNKKARSPIWDRFYVIFYKGVEQSFAKCRYCNAVYENDSARVTKQLNRHECENRLASEELNNSEQVEENQKASRELLEMIVNDPDKKHLITLIAKDPNKCSAWEHLELVYYNHVQQEFALCKHCNSLVKYNSSVGTQPIRKHVTKCPNIPKNGSNYENGAEMSDEEEGTGMDCSMLIPEVIYEKQQDYLDNSDGADVKFDDLVSGNEESFIGSFEPGQADNLFDKFQLMEWYENPLEREHFSFEKPKHNDDAEYWKTFEYVIYKNVRQKYCRCTQCGVYINFVSTRRRGLARHMKSCNKRLPLNYISSPTPKDKMVVAKKPQLNQSIQEVKPIISKTKISTPSAANNTSNKSCPTPQLAAALTTPSKADPASMQNAPLKTPLLSKKDRSLTIDVRNQLIIQQMTLVTNDMYPIEFLDSENFRELAQTLINIGAEHGSHRIDEVLTTKETLVKYWIPAKVSKIKKLFREILFNENILNFSVDLYENKLHKSLNFKYVITVTGYLLTENFNFKTMTLGTREFSEEISSDDVLKAFLKIVGEYYDTSNLKEKCCIVIGNKEILKKAFELYTCLPSVTDNLRRIFNDLLVSPDLSNEVTDNAKKIMELFEYLREKYSYHSVSTESLMDQIEEFYEMYETIKKLLKDKKDHHRLSNISRHTMKTVINFLELIKLCMDTLKSKNQSSIGGVLLWKKKLLEHYQPALHEHKLTAELKRKTVEALENQMDVNHNLYKLGLFMNPNFKSLKILSEEERNSVVKLAKQSINEVNQPNPNEDIAPAVKRIKFESSEELFAEYSDKQGATNSTHTTPPTTMDETVIAAEIQKYINDTRTTNQMGDDLVEFWSKCKAFPNLKKLSRKILSIPTCSNGIDEAMLLNANRSYREVFSTSQSQSLLSLEEFHSVLFINRNFNFIAELE